MARLLFAIFMYSFLEIQTQALHRPELTVNPPVITETDSVTLNCQTPSSVSVPQCYLRTDRSLAVKSSSCLQTLTGTELLNMSVQSSPAEVKLMCFYTLKVGELNSKSPFSDISSIIIHSTVKNESNMIPTKSTFAMTTVDQTLHESSTETSLSSVTPPNPAPAFTMTSGLTVSMPHVTTPETPAKQTSVDQTLHESSTKARMSSVTPSNPAAETKKWWKWNIWMLFIVVAGFGVIVGVIFLALTLLCTKGKTERYSDQRTQANVTDDVMCMQSLDHGGLLPVGNDEAYSVITSVPGADCLAGSEKLDRQRPHNEDSDIYHVYATIPEQPSPSALNVVYSTVQAH